MVKVRSLILVLLLITQLAPLLAPMAGAIFLKGNAPDNMDPYLLAASSGLVADGGGPNDGLFTPAYDPGPAGGSGEMPLEPTAAPVSAQKVIATSMPSYVGSPPSVPAIRSFATATNTGAETVVPPDYSAPATSSKFNPYPPVDGLQHANLAAMGYDVSKIGGIAMPSMPARSPAGIGIPMFRFPTLFG